MTSLCVLDRYPEAVVHNIDYNNDALKVSQELSEKLEYGERMSFSCEDVNDESMRTANGVYTSKWEIFDVVFLAALVGMDTDAKLSILQSLSRKLQPGTLVVARSARGLRSVLYPVSWHGSHVLVRWANKGRSSSYRRAWNALGLRFWWKYILGRKW